MATLTFAQIQEQDGLADWRVILGVLRASFATPDMSTGVEFVGAVVAAANEANHHPDLVLTYPRVEVDLVTHDAGGLTVRDVEMARTISGIAAGMGLQPEPGRRQVMEYAIDALDIDAVRPFWQAVTGLQPDADGNLPAAGVGQVALWFQQMDAPRPQRNRIHLDVAVPVEVAEQRVAAAVAAGGRLLSEAAAPAFWVLADAEGNEVCVCTSAGRD
ncbi:VOC family protein [Pseudactinotalea suaedae]|uniref:VOC family protein n=1 Tax=Pseudactinotalea suaedae TaxID=1524924 RepID=UPI0012E0F328|nr:VOC family protein [Pseudactinotalea suaedae]